MDLDRLWWALAIVVLAGIREKLKYSDIPDGLERIRRNFYNCWFNEFWFYVIRRNITLKYEY